MKNFLFHRINPQRDKLWDPMDVKLFDRIVSYLSKKYDIVLFEDIVQDKSQIKPNMATIMFDDGYLDNLSFAAPILKKYSVNASFYVATSCIDKNIPTWTYLLDNALTKTEKKKVDLDFDFLPSKFHHLQLQNQQIIRELKPKLKTLGFEDRKMVLDSLHGQIDDVDVPQIMMSWDHVRELKSLGHYIGSHSVNHFMLGTLVDKQTIRSEVINSGNRIKEELGYFPTTFSYPIGSYSATVINECQNAGYNYGLAVKQKEYRVHKDSNFEIPRIELYNESWVKTLARIHGVVGSIKKLMGK